MSRFSVWTQALRMLRRDWRAGELNLLLVALVLAVAALASVSFLADRMHAGLERDARQLIGADVLVVSDQPLPPDIEDTTLTGGDPQVVRNRVSAIVDRFGLAADALALHWSPPPLRTACSHRLCTPSATWQV